MDTTMSEVVQFIQENDVKFIRLAFCDIFGNQKNIAIQPTELTRAFEYGIHFNASALRGFLNVDASDLLLFPDPATLSVLPWRPAQGRVVRFYCDIRYPDGTPFEGDGRYLLRQASRRARKAGYSHDHVHRERVLPVRARRERPPDHHPPRPRRIFRRRAARQGGKRAPSDLPDTRGDGHPAGVLAPRAGSRPERGRFPRRGGARGSG